MAKKKPVVWYVDDLPSNLDRFEREHRRAFMVRRFSRPEEVIAALTEAQPDALLCDVFFYETVEIAEEKEEQVRKKVEELQQFGADIGANSLATQQGIPLIETVAERFGKRFPIYAYTSKGPFILDKHGFDRIGSAGAKWLFKNKYGSPTEQLIIQKDIEEFRSRNSITTRLAQRFWLAVFGSGFIGGLAVWFLTEGFSKLFSCLRTRL
jgi:hypothetical protein